MHLTQVAVAVELERGGLDGDVFEGLNGGARDHEGAANVRRAVRIHPRQRALSELERGRHKVRRVELRARQSEAASEGGGADERLAVGEGRLGSVDGGRGEVTRDLEEAG